MLVDSLVFELDGLEMRSISEDCSEDIVEIMGDPTRKETDTFHLLRLQQLFFELPLIRNILEHRNNVHQ